ncbi:MAG: hypothetical protein ACE5L7_03005 [Candidatus Aminicenantales bacterium]
MRRFLFLVLFCFFLIEGLPRAGLCLDARKENVLSTETKRMREGQKDKEPPSHSIWINQENEKTLEELREAEKRLRCLLRERGVLVGDFYGINITAYRYVNIFDRLRYIRYRIRQIDKKIKETKLKILELKKKIKRDLSVKSKFLFENSHS